MQATVPAAPCGAEAIDHSNARTCAASSVRSNRDRDRARSGVTFFKRERSSWRGKTQDRDVGSTIATGDLGSGERTTRGRNFKFIAPRERLLRGDDDIGPPPDTGNLSSMRDGSGSNSG